MGRAYCPGSGHDGEVLAWTSPLPVSQVKRAVERGLAARGAGGAGSRRAAPHLGRDNFVTRVDIHDLGAVPDGQGQGYPRSRGRTAPPQQARPVWSHQGRGARPPGSGARAARRMKYALVPPRHAGTWGPP
jgi:hypothetical protein